MTARLRFFILICVLSLPVLLRAQGVTTGPIDQALGRSGQKMGDVYRVGFPRTDLHVSVNGLAIKPGLALGSWAAFLGTDDNAMVMGDLVLLEEEVNPVIAKLLSYNFEITAVHNHLMAETPRVLYVHYMGHGSAKQLATSHRQAAKTRTWAVAEDKAVELQEQLDRGDTPKPIIVKGPQPTIAECIDTFISPKRARTSPPAE